MRKYNEKMVINNGKMIYAISLKDKSDNNSSGRNHIYMRDGQIYFSDGWFNGEVEFNFNDEAHRIAKEIFVSQLQVDIKRRILELKQLEEIFDDIGLKECISDSIVNNSKIFLELKEQVINETKNEINDAIKEQVKPIARKKPKKESKGE